MSDLVVRDATRKDVLAYFGRELPYTARVRVAEENGEVIGVAGYYLIGNNAIVFSGMRDAMRKYRKVILREAKRTMESLRCNAFCLAQEDEPTAPRFLEHLGWKHHKTTEDGEVYRWLIH